MRCKKIVEKYKNQIGLNNAQMADQLSDGLEMINPIKRQTVYSWNKGISDPSTDFLVLVLIKYRDWRFDFALDCLSAKDPWVWGEDGRFWEVNRAVKKRGQEAAF